MTKKGEQIVLKFIGITLVATSILLVGCGKNSEQKGNALDSFDPNKTEKIEQNHKSNNALDSFDSDKKQ